MPAVCHRPAMFGNDLPTGCGQLWEKFWNDWGAGFRLKAEADPTLQLGHHVPDTLTTRALNRALLARQQLLAPAALTPLGMIAHLVGMQAQIPNSPYIGLWTRLSDFALDDLTRLVQSRRVVRLALMRATIHLVTAPDCLTLRPLLQPVLNRGLKGSFGRKLKGLRLDAVAAAGRSLVEERPRTLNDVGTVLQKRWRDRDREALGQAVRALVPLVQVPPRGIWGASGPTALTPAETWLRRPLAARPSIDKVILRYLGAFGPSSVRDMQAWSGLTGLREPTERLRRRLRTFADERGVELFDLPGAPRPDPDMPAPVRFLPEFDNVLLAHADRTRIVSDDRRIMLFGTGPLAGTFLADGFAVGRWGIARARETATLSVKPFTPLSRGMREAVADEGARLLDFAAADAVDRDVRVLR